MSQKLIDQLYALTVPEIQKVFLEVMQGIVDRAMIDEMIKAVELGDEEALIRASGFNVAILNKILDVIEDTYSKAAELTVEGWPSPIRTPTGLIAFAFDMRNSWVENDVRTNSSQYIARISEEVRNNIRQTLQKGVIRGDNPRETALNIVGRINPVTKKREGGTLGIDSRQLRWANNAQTYLEQLDKRYFTLGLRDKRFDKTVQKAIDEGKPLPKETVQKLITSYRNAALKYRAETVARTETIQSMNRGRYAAHRQAIDEGTLRESAITKEWLDTNDSRVRTTHSILGYKFGRGKGIAFDAPFVSPSGARLMFPSDSSLSAPPEERIMCRCGLNYVVDWNKNSGR